MFIASLIAYTILLITLIFIPLEFSGYKNTDTLAPIWYLITESGGIVGSSLIMIMLALYLFFHFRTTGKRMRYLIELIGLIAIVELSSLAFTQLYTKEIVKEARPSQMYFVQKGVIENEGREFFSMPMKEKEDYLKLRTEVRKSDLEEVYPPILSSWTTDSGFSFPSGHSQSSFFLGVMIAYAIFRSVDHSKRFFSLIPLLWAILVSLSRVIIGVHYPEDVAAGAAIGIVLAFSLISLKITDRALRIPAH